MVGHSQEMGQEISGRMSSIHEKSFICFTAVSQSWSTCELNLNQLASNHIVQPRFTTIAQYQTVTLECESGWSYLNSETRRTLICTGSNTWNATEEEACEVVSEIQVANEFCLGQLSPVKIIIVSILLRSTMEVVLSQWVKILVPQRGIGGQCGAVTVLWSS